MGKIALWFYAIVGSGYWVLSKFDGGIVDRYATGLLWLLMMAAPVVLMALITWPYAMRMLDKSES